MTAFDPTTDHGLPDPGGLNIEYEDANSFEPTPDQLERLRSELDTVAAGVRRHLTDDFTISTRINRAQDGIQAHVIVEFPTGEAIGPTISVTADMFDGAEEADWNGPIPPEDIEELRHEITTAAVTHWADRLDQLGGGNPRPAS